MPQGLELIYNAYCRQNGAFKDTLPGLKFHPRMQSRLELCFGITGLMRQAAGQLLQAGTGFQSDHKTIRQQEFHTDIWK